MKEILEFEQTGSAKEIWEEVSLSLADLMTGEVSQERSPIKDKVQTIEDFEIQIMTPPPKTPATTITIPDSDTELSEDRLPASEILPENRPDNSPTPDIPRLSIEFLKPRSLPPSHPVRNSTELSTPLPLLRATTPLSNSSSPEEPTNLSSHRISLSAHKQEMPPAHHNWTPSSPSLSTSVLKPQKDSSLVKAKSRDTPTPFPRDQCSLEVSPQSFKVSPG